MVKLWPALVALLLAAPAVAQDNCKLKPVASLPLMLKNNESAVPVTIGGKPLEFLVDTGGAFSMITDRAAKSLGLAYKHEETGIRGIANEQYNDITEAHDFGLGGAITPKFWLVVQKGNFPDWLDGILSPDILAGFDADFDFGRGKLNLISQDHCAGQVTYWTDGDVARVPFELGPSHHIALKLQIDGKDFDAILDTGASHSLVGLEDAERWLGLDEKNPDLHAGGMVNGLAKSYVYTFKTLTLGGLQVANPRVVLISDLALEASLPPQTTGTRLTGGMGLPHVLLGLDILKNLHLYVAYKEKMLYITPADAH